MDTQFSSQSMPNPNLVPGSLPVEQARPNGERLAAPRTPAAPEIAPNGLNPSAGAPPVTHPSVDPMALAMAQSVPTTAAPAPAGAVVAAAAMPNMAADVDVIEPEWVAKAEAVVRAHAGDPYGEEEAVEEMQEDYLQKRYGFTVHEPEDDTTKTDTV